MNIKSLLLGSAAALVAATGARAADAIVIAEPEPMEYVRICDMYGAGFFYIPGTENCLKIGGYIRYQMNYNEDGAGADSYSFTKQARFAPTFDVRTETEWGTLRGFAEIRFNWFSGLVPSTVTEVNHAFIELQQAMGTFRIGKGDTPYARFLGYGSPFGPFDGSYGFNNSGEISYTFNGGNGFSAVIAAVEIANSNKFDVGVEGGVNFTQGWGSVGAMAGYDTFTEEWGAKAVVNATFGLFSVGAHAYYSSGDSIYAIDNPFGGVSEISVLAYAKANVNEKLAVAAAVQWFDDENAFDDTWQLTGGLDWRPVSGLRIRPEIQYTKTDAPAGFDDSNWRAALRFDRSF
ncbi:porin [Mesorhizobium sp. CAU 1732]|uniref:porin n=1 Tax=Mesorhizobium sp. CAU 1732 TaxID=3140358 RepID=UPI003261AE8B